MLRFDSPCVTPPSRAVSISRRTALILCFVLLTVPLLTGCDLLYQLIGDGSSGGGAGTAPQAVMAVQIDDDLVDMGLNPDLRPPIWYSFSGADSLNADGVSILDPIAGYHELAWNFGDGTTIDFSASKSAKQHIYREEGTYTASLTVRDAIGASHTAQQAITIGPAWLEIVSVATANRTDGQIDVTVVVRNQSSQSLRVFTVELLVDDQIWPSNLSATVDDFPPNGIYTLTTAVGAYTGTLRARSSFCTPVSGGG